MRLVYYPTRGWKKNHVREKHNFSFNLVRWTDYLGKGSKRRKTTNFLSNVKNVIPGKAVKITWPCDVSIPACVCRKAAFPQQSHDGCWVCELLVPFKVEGKEEAKSMHDASLLIWYERLNNDWNSRIKILFKCTKVHVLSHHLPEAFVSKSITVCFSPVLP